MEYQFDKDRRNLSGISEGGIIEGISSVENFYEMRKIGTVLYD